MQGSKDHNDSTRRPDVSAIPDDSERTERRPRDRRLKPAEVEAVLRRSAQLGSLRWSSIRDGVAAGSRTVSPEVMVKIGEAAGIDPQDVERAVAELFSDRAADPPTYHRTLMGASRVRMVRSVPCVSGLAFEHMEEVLRRDQGLKLRHRAGGFSVWDPGQTPGLIRRTVDLVAEKPLHRARSVEVVVEDTEPERCSVDVIADLANQRSEYLSLAGIVAITIAVLFVFAGIQNPLWLLGLVPALLACVGAFRLAFMKTRSDIAGVLDHVLDVAEGDSLRGRAADRPSRKPGQIQTLKPIPRFLKEQDEEGRD